MNLAIIYDGSASGIRDVVYKPVSGPDDHIFIFSSLEQLENFGHYTIDRVIIRADWTWDEIPRMFKDLCTPTCSISYETY